MRVGAVAALLCVVSLAGCFGGGGDGESTPTPRPTRTPTPSPTMSPIQFVPLLLGFSLDGCDGITVHAMQDSAAVQALLPDGFTVAATDGQAVVAVDILYCTALATATARVNDTWIGMAYTHVLPPERGPVVEAGVHEYAWRILAGTDVLDTLWRAAGFEVRNGTGSLTHFVDDSVLAVSRASLAGYTANAQVLGLSPLTRDTAFARYSEHRDGGLLVWQGTYQGEARAGLGSTTVPDDDPAAGMADRLGALRGEAWRHRDLNVVDQELRWYPGA